ncbi:MAG: hypothetical protein WCK98_04725 [bacterium]
MSKIPKGKLSLAIVSVLVLASGIGVAFNNFLPSKELQNAKASEVGSSLSAQSDSSSQTSLTDEEKVKQKVKDNPDAGLETIDPQTLEKSKFYINTLPRFLVENELKSQLKDGYLTQNQYDSFIKMLEDKDKK